MTASARRPGADILKLIASSAGPVAVVGTVQIYSITTGGIAQLFAVAGDGTISQLTPVLLDSGFFGDGSDGNATMDGAAVVAGMTPVANVYTAARDYFFDTLTISTGISFKTVGFRLFCKTLLVLEGTSKVHFNGNNGVAGGTGAGGGGAGGAAVAAAVLGGSLAGGAGNGAGAGTGGGASATAPRGFVAGGATAGTAGTAGAVGGAGGNGGVGQGGGGGGGGGHGAGNGSLGGAGGANTTATIGNGDIRAMPSIFTGRNATGTQFTTGGAGGGGGSGGNSGSGQQGAGGGGGASGGYVLVCSRQISGTGTIEANGGNGSNGGPATGGNCGGGAAGAGGPGGIVAVYTSDNTFSTSQITANAGTSGTGGAGNGTGGAGGAAGTAGAGLKIYATL